VERACLPPPKKKRVKKDKMGKTGAVSALDQLLSNQEREEEVALAAWRSQNASEEKEAELEYVGTHLEEVFGPAAESQTAGEGDHAMAEHAGGDAGALEAGGQSNDHAPQDHAGGFNSEHRLHDPAGHQTKSQAQSTQISSQPSGWPTQTLIVADPFILDKVRLCLVARPLDNSNGHSRILAPVSLKTVSNVSRGNVKTHALRSRVEAI
jgi:hypothetical protein